MCRDGVDCVGYGCTWGYPKGYVAPTGKGDKGKGKGKDKGKGSKSTWKCQKPGCSDPQNLSRYRKLCTTCFKDLGAKGENARIKLTDGTTFTLSKTEYKNANWAAVKKEKASKREASEAPFNATQLEFLKGTMNAITITTKTITLHVDENSGNSSEDWRVGMTIDDAKDACRNSDYGFTFSGGCVCTLASIRAGFEIIWGTEICPKHQSHVTEQEEDLKCSCNGGGYDHDVEEHFF